MIYYVITKEPTFCAITTFNPYGIGLDTLGFSISEMDEQIPDLNVSSWDYENATFVESLTKLTKLKFQSKFTMQERIAIRNSTDPIVIDIMALLDAAEYVEVTNSQTIQSINYLAMVGLIAPTRIAEILI